MEYKVVNKHSVKYLESERDGVMFHIKKTKYKRSQGGLLAFVLLAFLAISVFSLSILFVFNNNFKMAKYQGDSMEAYYVAYSGVEIAYAALLSNSSAKLIELTRTLHPVSEHTENDLLIGNGTVDIIAKITQDTGFENWVKITAVATMNQTGAIYRRTMYFKPSDPTNIVWVNQ